MLPVSSILTAIALSTDDDNGKNDTSYLDNDGFTDVDSPLTFDITSSGSDDDTNKNYYWVLSDDTGTLKTETFFHLHSRYDYICSPADGRCS